jgi:3-deoxy-D-manno-octulosonic acid kinase
VRDVLECSKDAGGDTCATWTRELNLETHLERTLHCSGKTAIVRSADPAVDAALFERAGCEAVSSHGRGAVYRFPFTDGLGILRPYRRGGAARLILNDSYLFVNRPRQEWDVHGYLFDRGFPVPEPLGVVWERSGVIYRGAFATRWVDALDILEFSREDPEEAPSIYRQIGETIRRMHDLGVYHADLQVKNILVRRDNREVLFIDFDNARRGNRLSAIARARNLLRLRRSCAKNGMPPEMFAAIQQGYGMNTFPWWLDRLYRIKGSVSDAAAGREGIHAG